MYLSEEASQGIEYMRRFAKLLALFSMDDCDRLVAWELICSDDPWPVKSLADYIHYPRMTVRDRIRKLETMALAQMTPRGVVLTHMGRKFGAWSINEAHEIVMGRQTGFSPALLDAIDAFPDGHDRRLLTTPPELRTIAFPPLKICASRD